MPSAVSSSQGAVAVLRFGRLAAMGTVAALIVVAGVWGAWGTAQYVMLTKGREQGTMTVARCSDHTCSGPYVPSTAGSAARKRVVIGNSVAVRRGEVLAVAVKPESDEVVRTGPAGMLYAWLPLAGALLLASVVVAGGLRMTRTAWVLAGTGFAMLTATFFALQ
ncbi:hypothetical protein ACWEO4_03530 [Streptomyces sp. NPDC004393]|uniref:hypothetical protein n=1 Tax=Streptomyces sp. NPDC004533 TaxID=3154278 RepID=UPI0033B160DC